ncbi:hypothetical protein [uncultured Phascolarctobacterium sp.]|uniref:hypothetical protein n=1 Tax=uncultured Phascolarctobacterium sp. TaxID=512296 RepID=UPI00260E903B|nr:hypothetical protein [uncultured Phascolarctobacterium sp.]
MNKYDLTDIEKMTFESENIPEFDYKREKNSYRLTEAQRRDMPNDENNLTTLRIKMCNYFGLILNGNSKLLEANCLILPNTFHKVMSCDNKRNVTYDLLCKFCIGLGLSEEQARELFSLMGYEITAAKKADYILLHYLNCDEGILDYARDMIDYCHEKPSKYGLE